MAQQNPKWPFAEPGSVDEFPAANPPDPYGGTVEGGQIGGTGGGKVPPPSDPPDEG